MHLLQAAIVAGMMLVTAAVIIFLVAVPVIALFVKSWLDGHNDKEQTQPQSADAIPVREEPVKRRSNVPASIIAAVFIVVVLLAIGLSLVNLLFPNID